MGMCWVFGHRYRFTADGATMMWACPCGAHGSKTYDSPRDAARYAAVFDDDGTRDIGRRAPVLGMFPLRLAHAVARRSRRRDRADTS